MAIRLTAVALGDDISLMRFFNFHLEISDLLNVEYVFICFALFKVHEMKWEKLFALPRPYTDYLANNKINLLFNILLDHLMRLMSGYFLQTP